MVSKVKHSPSPTWVLFASGKSVKVEISLYDPAAERSRPIEAYMVSDVGTDLARSASRAAEAIYAIAHTAKIAPPPTVVGYDLQGLGNGSHIAGQSSGLALALALAKKFWPDSDPGPIAATGEIAGSSNGGPLHKIAEIQAKGQAVLTLLPDGGHFFYPKDNDAEISETLKQSWREMGIKAQAVSSVMEALASFIPAITEKPIPEPELAASITASKEKRHPAPLLFVSFLFLITIAAALIYTTQPSPPKLVNHKPHIASSSKATANSATKVAAPSSAQKVSVTEPKQEQSPPQSAIKTGKIDTVTPPPLPTAAVKTDEPIAIPKNLPEITLTGTSGLADRLARRTQTRLNAFLDSEKHLQEQVKALDGRIEMIEIRERWDPQTESLSSTVTSAFHGQVTLKNGDLRKINLEPITVSSTGSMRQQLTNAATLMVERIAKSLQKNGHLKREKQSTPITPATGDAKGFE